MQQRPSSTGLDPIHMRQYPLLVKSTKLRKQMRPDGRE